MSTGNFWDPTVWGVLMIFFVLLSSMLIANFFKKTIKFLRKSLIPTSVLGGIILLIISAIYKSIFDSNFFNLDFFGGNGICVLEIITYHGLGIGFVAVTMHSKSKKLDKKRNIEVLNTGITSVATYVIQAIFGIIITLGFALIIKDLLPASGLLLAFGYGQGTGQALNFGTIYQNEFGFTGGASFGLSIAALGFLVASIGGVIYLNILRRTNKILINDNEVINSINSEEIQSSDEIPMNASIDKMTMQIAIVIGIYAIAFFVMYGFGSLLPGLKSVFFGFNFLFGVLIATIVKITLRLLRSKNIVRKQYVNPFLMNRISGFSFDLMIIAGIGAIQLDLIYKYWSVILVMGTVGAIVTFFYIQFVCKTLFKEYRYEEFFAMYGMLTGTASTGMILLREIDPDYKTPVADNLVFQNFPAILLGFPLMILAEFAPISKNNTYITLIICFIAFIMLNVLLFRSKLFKHKKIKIND